METPLPLGTPRHTWVQDSPCSVKKQRGLQDWIPWAGPLTLL